MPMKIDPKVKERCVQQMLEHVSEYPNPTAAAEVIAKRNGVGTESVRRRYLQAQVDAGHRRGATTEELAEIRDLKAKVRRLEEDNDILRRASIFFAGNSTPAGADRRVHRRVPPGRSCGRVDLPGPDRTGLSDRRTTYRAWSCEQQQVAARTFTDALVMDKVRDLVWTVDADGALAGVRRLTHEGLYGRRKMTKLVQRTMPEASPGAVDRAMKALGLKGIRRSKGVRTTIPGKDGTGAGDLLNRDFTAAAPNVGDGLHLLPELGRLRLRRVHRRRVRPEDRVPGTAPPPKTSSSS